MCLHVHNDEIRDLYKQILKYFKNQLLNIDFRRSQRKKETLIRFFKNVLIRQNLEIDVSRDNDIPVWHRFKKSIATI